MLPYILSLSKGRLVGAHLGRWAVETRIGEPWTHGSPIITLFLRPKAERVSCG